MHLLSQIYLILHLELRSFARYPRLIGATLLVACIPALYCFIYLASVWDPASRSDALPVGLVNLDQGVKYHLQEFNVGTEVATTLRKRHTFGFKDFEHEEDAREQVRKGALAFALIIPKDFSSNALPGQEAGAGKLVVYTSAGNNYQSAQLASSFARELGHDVNESLNERRWRLVLLNAAGSQRSVERLRSGVDQLRAGASALNKGMEPLVRGAQQTVVGSQRVNSGVDQLSNGVKQLAGGLRTMDAKRPRGTDLDRLKSGAEQMAAGHTELSKGMAELKTGGQTIRSSVAAFRDQAHDNVLVPAKVTESMDQLYGGVTQLDAGLQTALDAQSKLAEGADALNIGVGALTTGVRAMNQGIRTMVTKLPEDSLLDELDKGTDTLVAANTALASGAAKAQQGAARLSAGLDLLGNSLPPALDKPAGSAKGLANSVSPVVEVEAPVANSGSGFAPNIVPAALWLGAGVAAFLIHVRLLPVRAQHFSGPAKLIGKISIPLLIVLLQAGLVYAMVVYGLHIQVAMPGLFVATLALAATTFLAIVIALTRALGDAGKALSMIFLAVQLSSSGGVLPVELSDTLFSNISPWLPLTWVVRAMKICLFGAYEGAWQHPFTVIALTGLGALASACWVGRWTYMRPTSMRPAVSF
jgi:putative membrane protein